MGHRFWVPLHYTSGFLPLLLIPVSEYLAKAPRLPQRLPQMGLTGLAPSMAYAHARR